MTGDRCALWIARGTRCAALLASALTLAACGGGADAPTPASTAVGQFLRGTTEEPTAIDPELLAPALVCPEVTILPGTEALRREDAAGGPEALRWQASITRTARECSRAPEDGEAGPLLAVRVGVSGRVIEGARGAPDVVELPLRIAVRESGEVTYSRLHNVSVAVEGTSQPWAFVEEDIRIAAPDEAEIVVGFDS